MFKNATELDVLLSKRYFLRHTFWQFPSLQNWNSIDNAKTNVVVTSDGMSSSNVFTRKVTKSIFFSISST